MPQCIVSGIGKENISNAYQVHLLSKPLLSYAYVSVFKIKYWQTSILALFDLTLLHSERPKLYAILVFLSAIGFTANIDYQM